MTAVLPSRQTSATRSAPAAPRPGTLASAIQTLSDADRAVLEFELANPENGQAKNRLILSTFSMPVRRYYHLLLRIIESPAAMDEFPQVVSRCLRDERLQADETLWGRMHAAR
jgi:hypothetical protein